MENTFELEQLIKLANLDDLASMNDLAIKFLQGDGVEKDVGVAVFYLEKAVLLSDSPIIRKNYEIAKNQYDPCSYREAHATFKACLNLGNPGILACLFDLSSQIRNMNWAEGSPDQVKKNHEEQQALLRDVAATVGAYTLPLRKCTR